MTIKLHHFFVHRYNLDRSWDSLCVECFRTVSNDMVEAELATKEACHVCAGLDLGNWHRADKPVS
jgi:rRNA maturation endonuclease Nob1